MELIEAPAAIELEKLTADFEVCLCSLVYCPPTLAGRTKNERIEGSPGAIFSCARHGPSCQPVLLLRIQDGRLMVGRLRCFDKEKNIILTDTVEERKVEVIENPTPSMLSRFIFAQSHDSPDAGGAL